MWMLHMLWLVFAHDLLRVQIHEWRHVTLVFFVSFNMVHGFENVCESTKVFWIIIKQAKALRKVKQEIVTTKQMKKQETKRVLDNLRMPKQQEIFTTVAIVFHHCIITTRDSQFWKIFLWLFCFEQVKALKNFSPKLYTKDKQEKKKQRQEVTFGTTEKMPKLE